jgi:hypothetical protein
MKLSNRTLELSGQKVTAEIINECDEMLNNYLELYKRAIDKGAECGLTREQATRTTQDRINGCISSISNFANDLQGLNPQIDVDVTMDSLVREFKRLIILTGKIKGICSKEEGEVKTIVVTSPEQMVTS